QWWRLILESGRQKRSLATIRMGNIDVFGDIDTIRSEVPIMSLWRRRQAYSNASPIMNPFDVSDYRNHNYRRKKKVVQDAFITLTAPLLMLVAILIAWFLWY